MADVEPSRPSGSPKVAGTRPASPFLNGPHSDMRSKIWGDVSGKRSPLDDQEADESIGSKPHPEGPELCEVGSVHVEMSNSIPETRCKVSHCLPLPKGSFTY